MGGKTELPQIACASAKQWTAWLAKHQDSATGKWMATSLNKQRDPATAAANFMSDAATGFAVLALTYR